MRLRLSLFGPFHARLDGRDLRVTSRRGQAMLAMLALSPRGAVARDRLAATLWPDRAEDQARASLRQELSTLRRTVGADVLSADANCVMLARSVLDADVGAPADGDFLEGLDLRSEPFDDWRRAEAARLADGAAPDAGRAEATDIFQNPSVLVLGFAPAGASEEDTAFATGLVVDLRTSLASWRWFPVIGPEAIGWRTDRDGDLRAMASSVGAAYAIGGTVQRAGNRVRVSASLTDAGSGHLLWAENFDGLMTDVFEMQEAIAAAVVARVTPEIGRAEAARVTRRRPADMAAWQLVARTDELERTGGEGYGTPESNWAQVPLLEEALRREPDYARAWARLGRCHFRAALQGWVDDREAAIATALGHCERAVQADPTEWEAQAILALTLIFCRQEFPTGRFHAEEAVRLNPSAPYARHGLGCALEWIGEPETALAHLTRVFDLNPNHPNRAAVLGDVTTCQLFTGRIEEAAQTARQLRAIAPEYCRGLQRVVVSLGHAGATDEAAEVLARVMELQPDFDEAYVRETYPYAMAEHVDMVLDGLRRAGWTG